MKYILIYFTGVSAFSALITCIDKKRAVLGKRRVSELNLFTSAILGGALAMYITMLLIRHKTKHKRFMLGLPTIILVQALICIWAYLRINLMY